MYLSMIWRLELWFWCGSHPLPGPLEGVGPENRDFFWAQSFFRDGPKSLFFTQLYNVIVHLPHRKGAQYILASLVDADNLLWNCHGTMTEPLSNRQWPWISVVLSNVRCTAQGADPLSHSSTRNHLNEEITSVLPTGIGERCSKPYQI